jgi:2-dehydro-3-deoxy-D-gluconate 5-dehydrogenase
VTDVPAAAEQLFRLDGRTALVTGVRRGIGKAMAVALARAGADVVGVSATLESSGSEVEREVTALGRTFRGYACDFADRQSLYAFIRRVREEVPRVDILVNNAGTILRKPAAEHPDEYWDAVLEVNLNAQFVLTREIGKDMLARGAGKVVFVASLLSFQGGINVPSYAASKGGVAQLTKALANEWAARGVNVNAIAPGYMATDNTEALRADADRSRSILERIPAGRWGTPEDVAGPLVFLCSEAGAYVHGTVLPVDGGWLGR